MYGHDDTHSGNRFTARNQRLRDKPALWSRWLPIAELGETVAGYRLPAGYLGAIRQVIDQPRSPTVRVV